MTALAEATLSEAERRVLERFVAEFADRLGDQLRSVWLYGSRARGEAPGPESDVDLMVITSGGRRRDQRPADFLLWELAEEEGVDPTTFAPQVTTSEWIAGRREIKSFYIQEVDRDKIVLFGSP